MAQLLEGRRPPMGGPDAAEPSSSIIDFKEQHLRAGVVSDLPHKLRGRSDKYLASEPEGGTISRKRYYRVVRFRRQLLSKFQSNRTRSFVLNAFGNGRIRGFYKNGKRAISVRDSILVFGRKVAQRNQRAWMLCTEISPSMATVQNWFNEFQRGRFLMSHAQVPRKRLPRRIT